MKTEKTNKQERLSFFRSLYEGAKCSYSDKEEEFEKNMRQYRGSAEIDGGKENAVTVRNITYEIVESQVSSDIPQPKADAACYSEEKERSAHAIEALCRSLRDRLPFEEMNDLDERYTYIYGGSVWFIEWDSSLEFGDVTGGVRVHCISPRDFIPQPNVYTVDDMEYCFLKFTTTRGELMRKYGISEEESYLAECESEGEILSGTDTVLVILCFYRGESGEIGKYIFSGDLILSDIENYYKRKIKVCKKCGNTENTCLCEGKKSFDTLDVEYETVHDKRLGRVIENVPYYIPRSFPIVIRKNTSAEKSLFGQSDCYYIRPEQQAINKIESRILKKLLRSGVTPIVPEDAVVAVNNSVFGQIIKMKPGESMAQYGKVDTTPDISQDIAEAERLYDHSKRILGISDAYQGIGEFANESGVARQLRISQASGRLESKKKMKHTAYAHIDRLIFEHYLSFADEPRTFSEKDAYGRIHNASFNRYDFLIYDAQRGSFKYDDSYLFSVDLNGGSEYQRESLWQKNLENLKSGTLGDPSALQTLLRYWQSQERAHYPHARENVEYFSELIRKGGILSHDSMEESIGQN